MWIKSKSARINSKNDFTENSFLIVNLIERCPAIRVSEKARIDLGWDKGDFLNVYVDDEKIMLVKDNNSREFPLSIYQSKTKIYGFNIHSKLIKEICTNTGWINNKVYPVTIYETDGEKSLICFKDQLLSKTEIALLESRKKAKLK